MSEIAKLSSSRKLTGDPVRKAPMSGFPLKWVSIGTLGVILLGLPACDTSGEAALGAPGTSSGSLPAAFAAAQVGGATPSGGLGTADAGLDLSSSRETAVVRAAELVSPSVVAVHVLRTEQVQVQDPFLGNFFPFGRSFGGTRSQRVPSLGSGFVIDASGIILTNDHVVRGAEEILVTFPDGRDSKAELVGTDELTDVAVLRIPSGDLVAAPLGSTADLRIGEWVIAFGNPFGNLLSNPEPTVTVGVTSAIGRHIVPNQDEGGFYLGMIQTDAAINPGNSGGPLVNASGQVIGMNTSIFSRSGGSEGMGFAIPIERALRIADDLLTHGQVRRAWVGVFAEPEEADAFGRTLGVRVAQVAPESPAARAGVRTGDRLLEVNGRRLVTPLDFDAALLDLRVGDGLSVMVDGRSGAIPMTAEEIPSNRAERVRLFDGLDLVTLTPAIRSERRIAAQAGALVVGVSSTDIATITGIRAGDVIVGVGRRAIRSAEELSELLRQIPARTLVQFVLERNGQQIPTPEFYVG